MDKYVPDKMEAKNGMNVPCWGRYSNGNWLLLLVSLKLIRGHETLESSLSLQGELKEETFLHGCPTSAYT